MQKRAWLHNRTAIITFSVLLVGFLVISVANLFVFGMYLRISRQRVTPGRLANEFVRAVRLAQIIPPEKLQFHLRLLNGPGFRVNISKQLPTRAKLIMDTDPKILARLSYQHYHHFFFSLQLADGRWLNMRSRVIRYTWYFMGFIFSYLALFLALMLLCYWVVRRTTMPMRQFAQAVKRFGRDVQAPPMPMMGTTEMREVIDAFNEMQARIRRLLNDRTQMLAAISHDLRTPITRLQLRAEYLKESHQYEKAVADLKEMEQMIASILSFARDYTQTEAMERFDLNALLESICHDLVDLGQAVIFEENNQRLPILGRVTALKRALTNLIENAVKYGKKAQVSIEQKDQHLEIKIEDQGPGIPVSDMEKVFEPFYRVDPSRSPQLSGTGLGMAVARDIIMAHGGEIKLRNREPNGLMVLVLLPL